MRPPYRCPPPPHDDIVDSETLTGLVKLKEFRERKKIFYEFWVQVTIAGYRKYHSLSYRRNSTEAFTRTIWRKATDDEIDGLIASHKMVPVGD